MSDFQKPEVVESGCWVVETDLGTEFVPQTVAEIPANYIAQLETSDEIHDAVLDLLNDNYCEGVTESVEFKTSGYCYRTSAPGYLDSSAWGYADTLEEAVSELRQLVSEDDPEALETLADILPEFSDFFRQYLQALGFTAKDWSRTNPALEEPEDNPRSLFEGSGDFDSNFDVRGEIWDLLRDEQKCELLSDALGFLIETRAAIEADETVSGNRWERAGMDFHFTRNGHGAGFWDGDWSKDNGRKLSDIAKSYSSLELEGVRVDDGEEDDEHDVDSLHSLNFIH